MNKKIYIHIGYPKSASTFLQKAIFPEIVDAAVLPRSAITRLVVRMTEHLDTRSEAGVKGVRQDLAKIIEEFEAPNLIYSEEFLCGHPGLLFSDFEGNLAALEALFPDAKIIVIIRRQDKLLESMYKHAVRKNTSIPASVYINLEKANIVLPKPGEVRNLRSRPTDYRVYDYNKVVEGYFKVFGKDNVLVLPQELMQQDPTAFSAHLSEFTGLKFPNLFTFHPENRGLSVTGYRNHQILRKLYGTRSSNFMWRVIRYFLAQLIHMNTRISDNVSYHSARVMTDEARSTIQDYYRDRNLKLANSIGFDIQKFGY